MSYSVKVGTFLVIFGWTIFLDHIRKQLHIRLQNFIARDIHISNCSKIMLGNQDIVAIV